MSRDSRLTQYMDKRLIVHLNGERKIIGVLRGYDVSMREGDMDLKEMGEEGEKVD